MIARLVGDRLAGHPGRSGNLLEAYAERAEAVDIPRGYFLDEQGYPSPASGRHEKVRVTRAAMRGVA